MTTSTAVYLPHLDAIRAWLNGEARWIGNTMQVPVISRNPHEWLEGSPDDAPAPVVRSVMVYRRKFLAPAPWAVRPYVYVIPVATPAPNSEVVIVAGEAERRFWDETMRGWDGRPMPEWWGRDGRLPPIPG